MSVELTIRGDTLADCMNQVAGTVEEVSTDDLIEELRTRMKAQGMVVTIERDDAHSDAPSDAQDASKDASDTNQLKQLEKRKPGRPPKVAAAHSPASTLDTSKIADTALAPKTNGGNKPMDFNTAQTPHGDPALAQTPQTPPTQRELVIEALNAYAAKHGGQVAGREVMKKTCGATRLMDCKPEDYPKLLTALAAG